MATAEWWRSCVSVRSLHGAKVAAGAAGLAGVLAWACAHDRGVPPGEWPAVAGRPTHNLAAAAVAAFEPGVDYFPEKATFTHAQQISVSYHGHYKVARITTRGVGDQFEYVFVQRGTPQPRVSPDARVIAVPIRRFSLGTFRYGRAAQALGVVDRLVAFANHTHTTVPEILRLFDAGVLTRNADTEAIVNRRSEAHFNWHFPGRLSRADDTYARMGVPLVDMAEHLEPTPLARAEWIKFFAMFFNREAEAAALFAGIAGAYETLAAQVAALPTRPRVLVGTPQRDGWQIYGGANVHARIIEDAGGEYLWADDDSAQSGRGVPLEDGLTRARRADVWIIGPDAAFGPRLAEVTVGDPRYGYVPAVRDGRVFVANRNFPDGPNPWWDEALVNPHRELADHVQMLHPELASPGGAAPMTFYTRLAPPAGSQP